MLLEAIYHKPKLNWAYSFDKKTVHLRVRTKRNDMKQVQVIHGDKYIWDQSNQTDHMTLLSQDQFFDYWHIAITPPYRRLRYAFKFTDVSNSTIVLTEEDFVEKLPDNPNTFFDFPFINPVDVFEPPSWVKDAVFYQIFPERFANGDPSINPPQVEAWGGKPTPTNFFGGDLQGVIDHLDYLQQLGITAIYFTPIFEATTNHKYDTEDYFTIDKHFGDKKVFKELIKQAHARGIKVMLDAVFNHCGKTFPPFVDALEKGEQSKYKDWFHVRSWPLQVIDNIPTYDTFAFEPKMPKLNTENDEVKAYLLDIAQYWIKEFDIDGWRLDVANEVDHQFWREFRQTVKALKPDVYILGEIWHDATAWLQGDQFDAVMNYPFTNAVLDFFANKSISAHAFKNRIGKQLANYSEQVTLSAFNLLDSHDTARLLTLANQNIKAMKQAALFQLTYPGAPCIYYGDEVGLDGGHDPDCRKCMEWDEQKQNKELLSFYQRLLKLRHTYGAFRSSQIAFLPIESDMQDHVIAYSRQDDNDSFIVIINTNENKTTASIKLETKQEFEVIWQNEAKLITATKSDSIELALDGYSFIILKQK